jgi:FkbM family methyltransferase
LKYYSQFGEDEFIVKNFRLKENGVFVDVGAGDPISISNSYYFEQKGWKVVCIDPLPSYAALLRSRRKCYVEQCAIKKFNGQTNLYFNRDANLATTIPDKNKNSISVACFTLEHILNKHKINKIDILSIDTEGTELEVFESMIWEQHKPKFIIIEHATHPHPSRAAEMIKYFKNYPYDIKLITTANLVLTLRNKML